jgi:hypothetical protein
MSPQEKRRISILKREHAKLITNLDAKYRLQLHDANSASFARGEAHGDREGFSRGTAAVKEAEGRAHAAGIKQGGADVRDLVLEHAGRLYKERKDTDAAAVREVHRLLVLPK